MLCDNLDFFSPKNLERNMLPSFCIIRMIFRVKHRTFQVFPKGVGEECGGGDIGTGKERGFENVK